MFYYVAPSKKTTIWCLSHDNFFLSVSNKYVMMYTKFCDITISIHYGNADFLFQQDLAPAHSDKTTSNYFTEHGITLLFSREAYMLSFSLKVKWLWASCSL